MRRPPDSDGDDGGKCEGLEETPSKARRDDGESEEEKKEDV